MYKVGIIGTGGISESHIQACLAHPDIVQIKGLADIKTEKANTINDKYKLNTAVYQDYVKMIDDTELDFTIINLPHFLHLPSVKECAKRGLNILLEKPMALNTDECDEMISLSKKYGIKLMIGHVIHYYPETIIAKRILNEGILGKLLMINDFRTNNYFTDDRPLWFLNKKQSGGGILVNLGAHSLDRTMFITGKKVKSIKSYIQCVHPKYHVEGHAKVEIELEGGIPVNITLYGYSDYEKNEIQMYFTEGVIEVKYGEGVTVYQNGIKKLYNETFMPSFEAELLDFVKYTEGRIENPIPAEYGKEVIRLIQQCYTMNEL